MNTEIQLILQIRADEASHPKDPGSDPRILHRRSPGEGRLFTNSFRRDGGYDRLTRSSKNRYKAQEPNKTKERDKVEKPDTDPGTIISTVHLEEESSGSREDPLLEPIAPFRGLGSVSSLEQSDFIEPPRSDSKGAELDEPPEKLVEEPIESHRRDLDQVDLTGSLQSAGPPQPLRPTASKRSEPRGSPQRSDSTGSLQESFHEAIGSASMSKTIGSPPEEMQDPSHSEYDVEAIKQELEQDVKSWRGCLPHSFYKVINYKYLKDLPSPDLTKQWRHLERDCILGTTMGPPKPFEVFC